MPGTVLCASFENDDDIGPEAKRQRKAARKIRRNTCKIEAQTGGLSLAAPSGNLQISTRRSVSLPRRHHDAFGGFVLEMIGPADVHDRAGQLCAVPIVANFVAA